MDRRADLLRTRIALYRSHLRGRLSTEEAARYLREIQRDEAELRAIAKEEQGVGAARQPKTS